jgi:hypothetical protein
MIGYVTVGTNGLRKGGEFRDKICGEVGMEHFMADDQLIAWGEARVGVARLCDGKPMTVGNGAMAAFSAKDKIASVSLRCRSAAPGKAPLGTAVRNSRPPEGNKLNGFVMGWRLIYVKTV